MESGGEGDQDGRREEKEIRRGGESGGVLSKSLAKSLCKSVVFLLNPYVNP